MSPAASTAGGEAREARAEEGLDEEHQGGQRADARRRGGPRAAAAAGAVASRRARRGRAPAGPPTGAATGRSPTGANPPVAGVGRRRRTAGASKVKPGVAASDTDAAADLEAGEVAGPGEGDEVLDAGRARHDRLDRGQRIGEGDEDRGGLVGQLEVDAEARRGEHARRCRPPASTGPASGDPDAGLGEDLVEAVGAGEHLGERVGRAADRPDQPAEPGLVGRVLGEPWMPLASIVTGVPSTDAPETVVPPVSLVVGRRPRWR